MTPTDFVHWMRGFVTACPKFHPTSEQWDLLKDQLQKVENQTPKTKLQYPPTLRGTTTHTGMPVFDQGTKELING